jgi:hypothetical protein
MGGSGFSVAAAVPWVVSWVSANAECSRTLYPGGTLIEIVDLNNGGDAHEVLSDEALDRFIESFPVRYWYEVNH